MARATRSKKKERMDLCIRALAQGFSETAIMELLIQQYGISERQAWRYLRMAKEDVRRVGKEVSDYELGIRVKQTEILADRSFKLVTQCENTDSKSLKDSFSLVKGALELRQKISRQGGDKKKNDAVHTDQAVEAAGLADLIQSLANQQAAG